MAPPPRHRPAARLPRKHTHAWTRIPPGDAPDEILRPDPGRLDGGPDQAGPGEPDAPGGPDHAEAQAERDAEVGVAVGGHVGEDLPPPRVAVLRYAGVRHGLSLSLSLWGLRLFLDWCYAGRGTLE